MKTFPRLTPDAVKFRLAKLLPMSSEEIEPIIEDLLFERSYWPPVAVNTRITEDEAMSIRSELPKLVAEIAKSYLVNKKEVKIEEIEDNKEKVKIEKIDRHFAEIIWSALKDKMSITDSMDYGVWHWVAISLLPDIIKRRWPNDPEGNHFTNVSKMRSWPLRMYWCAWVCAGNNNELNQDFLKIICKPDCQAAFIERTGMGYDREMMQACLIQLVEKDRNNLLNPKHWRGMTKRLNWIRGVRETSLLTPDEKLELAKELIEWADTNYIHN